MPIIPTYRAGVGAPNLAEAYLGSRRIAQQAASDAARIALGREQLAQEAIANQMELAAKREAMAQQAMKQAQEAEIEKAYRETQLGLRERELTNEEAFNKMRIDEAARNFEQQQLYQRKVQELTPTLGIEEASRQAILITGGTGLTRALGGPHVSRLDEVERMKLSSDISAIDREMTEQRKLLADVEKLPEEERLDRKIEIAGRLSSLSKRRKALFGPSKPTGTPAPSTPPQQWQVNPETIPFGAPGNPQIFIGTPGGPVPDPGMQPLREGFGIPAPATLSRETRTSIIPKVGDVVKGYRFKGGDPSSRSNWEKVK